MRKPTPLGRCVRLVLILIAVMWCSFPILMVVLSSFKQPHQIFETPPSLIFTPTLDNYRVLWSQHKEFFRGLLSSLYVTLGTTMAVICVSTCAGYVYARFSNPALNLSAFGLLAVRMLPPIIITLPLFPVVNALGMNDTHILLVILYTAFYVSLGTWIMRAFIMQLPIELEEAAAVDGASLRHILLRIILPLSVPGLISVCIFVVVFAWNEYFFALVFTTRDARTAPVVIGELLSTVEGVQWGVIFAAATVQLVPVLVLVIALQKYLVAGLTAGAVKS